MSWLKVRVEELKYPADSYRKVKELRKVTEKLEKDAAIAREEVVRLTGVVGEAKERATEAVEEWKHHPQVATLLQDRLDALISEGLEEHGEVREARQHTRPRGRDVEPAAL